MRTSVALRICLESCNVNMTFWNLLFQIFELPIHPSFVRFVKVILISLQVKMLALIANNQVLQQAPLFGAMGLQTSQYFAMLVVHDGGQREHWQIILLFMLEQNLMILKNTEFPKWKAFLLIRTKKWSSLKESRIMMVWWLVGWPLITTRVSGKW